MQISSVKRRGRVAFPAFTGERVYMREFTKAAGLPADLRRWQDTVDAMLDGVDASGPIYLMVDQGVVRSGVTHRRPGVHVDGYWIPRLQAHGGGGGQHRTNGAAEMETLAIASDVLGCAAYVGPFDGIPGVGGDCAHIDLCGMQRVEMEPGHVWMGHTLHMLHESLPVPRDCLRTVVRLNVPGWGAE